MKTILLSGDDLRRRMRRHRFLYASERAMAFLRPGDRVRVAKCPGRKRTIEFAGWEGPWMVSSSGINDYAPGCVDLVNGSPVDFNAGMDPVEILSSVLGMPLEEVKVITFEA